ncbi:MAG: CoA-binding protein [Dehalococcoidia bacterium]|nr:CoA-binding protein [Dehalococcoidia bacterium]
MPRHHDLKAELAPIFYPKSVAVVGATSGEVARYNAGNLFLMAISDFGYSGSLYAVGKSGGELDGKKIYTSVKDIPGDVEFVTVAIPNRFIPQLVEECGQKGVKIMHLFVSGFGESEDKVGAELQNEMMCIARKYNIRIIGPNCMGVYCPDSNMTMGINFSSKSGDVSFVAQSGGQCVMGIREANQRGIYFSKAVSYGNAADINECDLIEYLADDADTKIITAYIEGTTDGPRLLSVLKRASQKKPVVIFKSANTEGGTQAAVSHTSAIAGSNLTWDSLLRQANAIRVYSIKEMFDVVTVLKRCPPPQSLNTLVIGQGGGLCVQAADDCCRAGLKIPLLPEELRKALIKVYTSDIGSIFKNPLDINSFDGLDKACQAFNVVAGWNEADIILFQLSPEQMPLVPPELEYAVQTKTFLELSKLTSKPNLVVLNTNTISTTDGLAEKTFRVFINSGLAAFPTVERAATALNRVYQYYQRQKLIS